MSHHDRVEAQFGAQAAAYVSSAVHAKGADLERLAQLVASQRFSRALDLGCGGGHASYALASGGGAVVAYDLSQAMLDAVTTEIRKRGLTTIETVCGPVEALPFADASFDLICTRYSAHHWRDLGAGLGEARRVLRPGGQMIIIDTSSPEDPLYATFLQAVELLRDPSHVRNYTCAEWLAALHQATFVVTATRQETLTMSFQAWLARMTPPPLHVEAIASLCRMVAPEVLHRFQLDEADRFDLPTVEITVRA